MPRLTKTTTRRGDDGSTDLADGTRIAKDAPRMQVIGALDELTSVIGLALSFSPQPQRVEELRRIQNDLFHLGALFARPDAAAHAEGPRVTQQRIDELERKIGSLQEELGPLENFLLPGGSNNAAALHLARAVCRRAERDLVALARTEPVEKFSAVYLNRLSDLLFLLARAENKSAGIPETLWDSRK